MEQSNAHNEIITQLLAIDHKCIARKLNFINEEIPEISDSLLYKAISVIDHYSRFENDKSKQIVIVLSSILYTYKKEHWGGLSQFLVIVLSRIGYAPSAIMVDEDFNYDTNQFSSFDSFISQLSTAVFQYKNEIIIKGNTFLLTDFQKDIWDKCSNSDFVGISAPTSAGKSFVIILKAIENILKSGGNVVYVVPTLSLISQVTRDFHQSLKNFEINNYEILTSYNQDNTTNKIYVLTPERAISAYSEEDKPFGNVNTFIVDEIQNIERIENKKDERAKILFDSLVELSFSYSPNLIIFSGPRVSGLKDMGFDIFEEENTIEIQTNSSPVASFTYSIFKKGKKYYFKQYTQIYNQSSSIEIENTDFIKIGGKQYNEAYFDYLASIINSLGENNKNVIFAPSSGSARKIAVNLINRLDSQIEEKGRLSSLIEYISATVHPKYDLISTLKNKIAYHHGKVPLHIRNILEYSINEKMIDNIVCTTTLMQGVNLPAQNVVMRNGYLSTKKINGEMPELTNYEISNLRGRAGRLLKDIIGRTYVLDENAFKKEATQHTLFQDENKPLKSGYGNIFEKHKQKINVSIFNNKSISSESNEEFQFLITYIRNTILKHKENSYKRLNSVGINYSEEQTKQIYNELTKSISVPLEICFKNRYVDPLVIDKIYRNIGNYNLPSSSIDYNLADELYNLVNKIQSDFPELYEKHFKKRTLQKSFFYTVSKWGKEQLLSEILNSDYFDDSDNIDKTIDEIQKNICFELTALLKPFYTVKNLESKFVNCIEMGAYNPITIHLINLNVPREVAIILKNSIFKDFAENDVTDVSVKQVINENWNQISFWNQIQLVHLKK